MGISVTDPMSEASNHVRRLLFQPFNARTWFVLGFASFLADLGSGGGGGNFPSNFPGTGTGSSGTGSSGTGSSGAGSSSGSGSGGSEFDELIGSGVTWLGANIELVVGIGVAALVLLVGLGALFTWLSSRGKFIFLDGVVRETAAIAEPWHRLKDAGNSLFVFRFVLGMSSLAWILVSAGVAVLVWRANPGGEHPWLWPLLLFVGLVVPPVLAASVTAWLEETFGVLWMYANGGTAFAALGRVWREIVLQETKSLILFVLLSWALAFGAALIGFVAIVFTCCIGALPYLSSVLLLPIAVFFRAFSLHFAAQIGPQWRLRGTSTEELVNVFR